MEDIVEIIVQDGIPGPKGDPGESAYQIAVDNGFIGSQEEWLLSLKGEPGDQGIPGEKGDPGQNGEKGDTGSDGLSAYQVWLSEGNTGTEQDFLDSLKGEKGDQGERGLQGEHGAPGQDGLPGADGKSAYQIWLDEGNQGSEQDFLNSLIGEKGDQGIQGEKGDTGEGGLSAYQIWLDDGNTGSEQDFLDSLKGDQGDEGPQGPKGDPGEDVAKFYGTLAQYEALPNDKLTNGVEHFIAADPQP